MFAIIASIVCDCHIDGCSFAGNCFSFIAELFIWHCPIHVSVERCSAKGFSHSISEVILTVNSSDVYRIGRKVFSAEVVCQGEIFLI